ncbi:YARHG domain-containing protein [Flavobacterium sp. MAH-1]|uniref:YARHG domain-containing protein n=1 Tax=Flavobacterium agri TaxID=2743471 RepID=A0A7Y8XZR5_9FLAO|nr:YARHG domain-containing protein [Flavobacterium agri]NUY79289.1 YARHG domain-containing protein [Flavobacterium agri]NYA69313.1 YARHG domain-containing protein [Flavobacterium agri]
MKKLVLLALLVSAASCSLKETEKNEKLLALNHATTVNDDSPYTQLYGAWTGKLPDEQNASASRTVTYIITRIDSKHKTVIGNRSIDGKSQYVHGKVTENQNSLELTFRFWNDKLRKQLEQKLVFENGNLKGFIEASPKDNLPAVEFPLERKKPEYRAEVMTDSVNFIDWDNPKKEKASRKKYIRPSYPVSTEATYVLNASTQKFKESDLKNLKKTDLQLLRNTIYARHGYIFKNENQNRFFTRFDWYVPVSTDVEKDLTAVEKENIKLLVRFEKYAEDYYEYFGR